MLKENCLFQCMYCHPLNERPFVRTYLLKAIPHSLIHNLSSLHDDARLDGVYGYHDATGA